MNMSVFLYYETEICLKLSIVINKKKEPPAGQPLNLLSMSVDEVSFVFGVHDFLTVVKA